MAKRSINGMVDPYMTRRMGKNYRKIRIQRVVPLNHKGQAGLKDDAQTSRDLSEINREYQDKEAALASANGPHSTPEAHYPKSFFIVRKKEGEE